MEHDTESIYGSDYEKEKQRILSKDNIMSTGSLGEWKCVFFKYVPGEIMNGCDYNYLFFAYNDETHTVRYIAEYGHKDSPYHLELEW